MSQPADKPKPEAAPKGIEGQWNYMPDVPIQVSPFFTWPLRPMAMVRWVADRWFTVAENSILVGVACISWFWFQPSQQVTTTFSVDWIAQLYLRNFILLLVVAGGLHLYFHRWKKQQNKLKFDGRELRAKSRGFAAKQAQI